MCGILGVVATSPVNQLLYDGLMVLQHRGQDAAGIATAEGTISGNAPVPDTATPAMPTAHRATQVCETRIAPRRAIHAPETKLAIIAPR